MVEAKTAPKPARGYAPNKKAVDRLMAAGLLRGQIYEAEKGETWDKISMRSGESLGVVDGLRAFGLGKRTITKAVDRFHGQGATILDVETGKNSRTNGHVMFDVATGPRRLTDQDKEIMAEERASKFRKKHGMASKAEAHKIWHTIGPSVDAKVAATGWSKGALYKAFGKTGSPAGRRPKDFVASERELPPAKVKPKRIRKTQGFVYFMRINGRGHVKIGFTVDVIKRFSGHQTSMPGTPVLMGAMHGTAATEKKLHEKYADLHVKGEWYKYTGALKAFVEALPDVTIN